MEFQELMMGDEMVINPELRERTEHASIGSYTHPYLVRDRGEELAFVSLDYNSIEEQLVIYEIFVHSGVRHGGIGTHLQQIIESVAIKRGYTEILLHARPLDHRTQKSDLRAWYEKRGMSGKMMTRTPC